MFSGANVYNVMTRGSDKLSFPFFIVFGRVWIPAMAAEPQKAPLSPYHSIHRDNRLEIKSVLLRRQPRVFRVSSPLDFGLYRHLQSV